MTKFLPTFLSFSLLSFAFAVRPSTNAPSPTTAETRSQFLGTWKLVSTASQDAEDVAQWKVVWQKLK
jgi:hypothetical protein